MAQLPPWLQSPTLKNPVQQSSGTAPWLKGAGGSPSQAFGRGYFTEGGAAPRGLEYTTGLSTQPGMYGTTFNPSSSKTAFGQVGRTQQIGRGIPNFGQGVGRNTMLGDYLNYGLPTNRSYVDPTMMQTPLDRMNAQYQQTVEKLNTFWPTGVTRQNNRQSPGKTTGGAIATEDLGNPSGNGTNGPWSEVLKWSREILNAADTVEQQTGVYVPPNVIAAIMMIESGGNPQALSVQNYKGLMQVGDQSSGAEIFDWSRIFEPEYNTWAGTYGIAQKYLWLKNTYGDVLDGQEITWTDVAGAYFSGVNFRGVARDATGTSVSRYRDMFEQNMDMLGGASTSGQSLGVGKGSLSTIFGANNAIPALSQEFGLTPFALGDGRGMYDYTHSLTPDGSYGGHVGLDFDIPLGTPMYSPVSGTVTQVGGVPWERDSRYDVAPYTGGFRVQTDDGTIIILAHLQAIDRGLKIGDRIEAGTYVGESGTAGTGPHLHLEVRVPRESGEGFIAVDPREYFAGGIFIGQGGAPSNAGNGTENLIPGLPSARLGSPFSGSAMSHLPFWMRGPL